MAEQAFPILKCWAASSAARMAFGRRANQPSANSFKSLSAASWFSQNLMPIGRKLFSRFPLDVENKARRARAVDQHARPLAEWLDAHAARDNNDDEAAWRLRPCLSLMFVKAAGELDQKHDQDLRDTWR
jgi:hypothetical protein